MTDIRDTSIRSRRAVIRAGLGLVGTGVVACAGINAARAQPAAPAAAPAPAAGQKLAQAAVNYQSHPNNGQLCSICVNFVAPNACTIVEGKINPIGWCVAFAPKA